MAFFVFAPALSSGWLPFSACWLSDLFGFRAFGDFGFDPQPS